jgi:NADH-quinone oxidoreductase subunit N
MINQLYTFSPLIILTITALFVLLIDAFFKNGAARLTFFLSLVGISAASFASVGLWKEPSVSLFYEAIRLDRFSLFFTLLSLFLTFLTLLNVYRPLMEKRLPPGEFLFFLLTSAIGMSLMAWATDLITLFMSLEIMSLSVYILTGIEKERITATEGAFKYFLLGAFSTGFLLYGIALIYSTTGSILFSEISNFLVVSKQTLPTVFYIGAALLMVGFGFKIAAVPFHMWVPDVYEGAGTAVTALMATGIKAAGFAALVRFFIVALLSLKTEWNFVLFWLAVLTMTVGNLAALVQTNLKRMLAYSSIAHAGYLLVAVSAMQAQIFDLGTSAILFYLIAYGLMTIGAFSVMIFASYPKEKNFLDDYAGFGLQHPYLGLAMVLFMLSLTGIPLTAGFIGKFYIFSAALKSKDFILAIIAIINSIIAAYYYLRVIVVFYMRPQTFPIAIQSTFPLNLSLFLTSIGTIGLGLFPSAILKIIKDAVNALL